MQHPQLQQSTLAGRVEVVHADHVAVVAVHGEADLALAGELVAVLNTALAATDGVVVDLCGCTFLECVTLRVLLSAGRRAPMAENRLVIACLPDGEPERLFGLTGPHAIERYGSRDEALAAFTVAA